MRSEPSSENLNQLMNLDSFQTLVTTVLESSGTMSRMMVQYVRDVSMLLSMVSSVREKNIDRHLHAERAFLPQLFVFGHPNYSRYLTYQHLLLSSLDTSNPKAWESLKCNG